MLGHLTSLVSRAVVGLLAAGAVLIVPVGAASAHMTSDSSESSAGDLVYVVDSFRPGVSGVALRAVPGTGDLELVNSSAVEVTVLGYEGEPYLRVGPAGVFGNDLSPATHLNANPDGSASAPERADPEAAPEWRRLSDGSTVRWHDHRAHWMAPLPAEVTEDPGTELVLATWTIDVVVQGEVVAAQGRTIWVPGPSPLPWLGVAAVLAALVTAGLWSRWWRGVVAVGGAAMVLAGALDVVGTWLGSPDDLTSRLSASTTPILLGAVVAAGAVCVVRRQPEGPVLVAVGAAGTALLVVATRWSHLGASQLPVDLPPSLARAVVATSLGIGVALAMTPLVRRLRDPGPRRAPHLRVRWR